MQNQYIDGLHRTSCPRQPALRLTIVQFSLNSSLNSDNADPIYRFGSSNYGARFRQSLVPSLYTTNAAWDEVLYARKFKCLENVDMSSFPLKVGLVCTNYAGNGKCHRYWSQTASWPPASASAVWPPLESTPYRINGHQQPQNDGNKYPAETATYCLIPRKDIGMSGSVNFLRLVSN